MKLVYPVIISKTKTEGYFDVFVPDLQINTEGETIADAIEMARDAIGAKCLCMVEDLKQELPVSTDISSIECQDSEFVSLVDINYDEYKKMHMLKVVRRNVTLPSWINYEAEKSGINVSAVLTAALKKELHLADQPY